MQNKLNRLISLKKKNEVVRLKVQLEQIEKKLADINNQIKTLEKNEKISEWEKIDLVDGKSINELREQERKLSQDITLIQKDLRKTKSKYILITELFLLPILFLLVTASGIDTSIPDFASQNLGPLNTRLLIENLRGDTVDTWKSWRLVGTSMNVIIINPRGMPDDKIDVIIDAIISEKSIDVDDSITHKGPKGSKSTYYEGWKGGLMQTNGLDTLYNIPTEFNIIKSHTQGGDIIITLSNIKDNDGYTGYTKSIVDGNEILKSFITIYDVSNLTDEQLATIVRHEFGHALGLGHSTAPEDLMAPSIDMTVPYISECNMAAIVDLYSGIQGSTVCEK